MTRIFFWHKDLTDRTDACSCWDAHMALLNENDTNEINTDSTRSFVITHCLCSVLKLEFLYSFSPTIGKQAFIVIHYRKGAKASLLYIIQCLKFSSEETCF